MDQAHLQELIDLEERYWWHLAKRRLVTGLLQRNCPPPGRLVEGGIGGGGNLRTFRDMGYTVQGFDASPESVAHCQTRGLPATVHDLETPWPVEEPANVVVMLDVLEHMVDPVAVLAHVRGLLAPRGVVILTVPAIQALYGPWDRMAGHQRRYSGRDLREQAQAAGLSVQWMSHWNAFTLPGALGVRVWERLTNRPSGHEFPRVSPVINRALRGMARGERGWMRLAPVPIGLSLCGVLTA